MQPSAATMRVGLRQEADFMVIAVDQDQLLVIAGDNSVVAFQDVPPVPPRPASVWQRRGVASRSSSGWLEAPAPNPLRQRKTRWPDRCWPAETVAARRWPHHDAPARRVDG